MKRDVIRKIQTAMAFVLVILDTNAPCVYLTNSVVYARSLNGLSSLILNDGVNSRVVLEWWPSNALPTCYGINAENVNADDIKVVAHSVFDMVSKLSMKQMEAVR